MFNPILGEQIAHEQYKDRIRQAERNLLANAAIAQRPRHRYDLRAAGDNMLIAARSLFRALARRLGAT